MKTKPFSTPIFVTQPLLPEIGRFTSEIESIWDSKILTNIGNKHKALENKVKSLLKVSCLSLFNNGTTALMTAINALSLKGEVITTPFTFPATPNALSWCGIRPVFCDIDPISCTIDVNKITPLITSKTSAILPVHVYGIPCDVKTIEKIARKHNLKVIYDAAHVFNTEIEGRGIGTFGDISMFSFHATKLFHCIEGGCLTTNDNQLEKKINLMRNFGIVNEEEVTEIGINGKLNELQASVGLLVLEILEREIEKRKKLHFLYQAHLSNISGITMIMYPSNITPNYQYAVIRVDPQVYGRTRDELQERLKEFNVFSRKYFYPLCSNFSSYQHLPSSQSSRLTIANQISTEVLALPIYGDLPLKHAEIICSLIKEIKQK